MSIHPFSDGNGRTSRLLMNLLLLRAGYPPVVVRPEDRPAYFGALDAARAGERGRHHGFMGERLVRALEHYLEIGRLGARGWPFKDGCGVARLDAFDYEAV